MTRDDATTLSQAWFPWLCCGTSNDNDPNINYYPTSVFSTGRAVVNRGSEKRDGGGGYFKNIDITRKMNQDP